MPVYDRRRMSFFAVLFALLIEQLKPLPRSNPVHDTLTSWMRWTGRNFDAGKPHHAWVVWCVTTIAPSLLVWLVYLAFLRFSIFLALAWNVVVLNRTVGEPINERLMALSQRMFSLVDHLPARLTAFGFAVVGNFEEAVSCWRRDATLWKHPNEGIILAAAAGAVGVRLGGSAAPGVTPDRSKTFDRGGAPDEVDAEGSTTGAEPVLGHLRSIVGLVWRSVVLWMLLLALLSLANLIG